MALAWAVALYSRADEFHVQLYLVGLELAQAG